MGITLATRMQKIKPSPTMAVAEKAAKLKAEGKDIIGLGTGEPDFDTPLHIKEAAVAAIHAGFTKYTAVDGIMDLKKAIQQKFLHENQLDYHLNQIIVGTGGKQCCYNLCMALLNPGDEVIIPAPYWVSYPDMVLLADAVPVIISTNIAQSFKISPQQLRQAITPKTKLVFLDLTDFSENEENGVSVINREEYIIKYGLFQPLMTQIYNYIFEKYRDYIIRYEDGSMFMCVDNPCKNTPTIEEITSAYGGYYGFRNSEESIDRFVTMELFQIIKDLNIEKEQNCIVMGYFHADVIVGDIDEDKKTPVLEEEGYFPAEFAIKYGYSINKNCIEFKGEIPSEKKELDVVGKIKRGGTKNKKKIKNNKKTKKLKRIKNCK